MPLTGAFHLSRRVVNSAPPSSFFTLAFLVLFDTAKVRQFSANVKICHGC